MSESKNTALARRWFEEVWNVRREETVRELMGQVCEGHMEGGLEVRGPDELHRGAHGAPRGVPGLPRDR
jgi:hypothetical protein